MPALVSKNFGSFLLSRCSTTVKQVLAIPSALQASGACINCGGGQAQPRDSAKFGAGVPTAECGGCGEDGEVCGGRSVKVTANSAPKRPIAAAACESPFGGRNL